MAPTTTSSAIVPTNSPVAASQSLARPLTPTVVKMVPSALMLMSQPPGTWNGLRRNDPVRRPRWLPLDRVAAASVSPSGEKASAPGHSTVSNLRRPDRGQDHRIPEADALLLETDRDQPSVGAEDPGVPRERDVGNRVVREGEAPLEPAVAREVPGDRRPVVARRVQRLPVGTKGGLLYRTRWPASVSRRVADGASQSATVPSRLVETSPCHHPG